MPTARAANKTGNGDSRMIKESVRWATDRSAVERTIGAARCQRQARVDGLKGGRYAAPLR